MGIASDQDVQKLEQLSGEHAEIKEEIAAVRMALERYATAHAVKPKTSVKEGLMAKINNPATVQKSGPKVVPIDRGSQNDETASNTVWLLAAASLILLMGSITANIYFYGQWQNANDQIATLQSERDVFADDLEVLRANYSELSENYTALSEDVDVLTDPFNQVIKMQGLDIAPEALATVYWNEKSQEVFIDVNNLPTPAEDKQYQLWAIVDGAPVDMGVFEVNADTAKLQRMKVTGSAQAFAVTLEKRGGSATPTLEEMYVVGNVGG